MAEGSTSVEIFCCYAREDETWLRKLETHLSLLKRQNLITLWYDRFIAPGTNWAKAIDTHLETASVILLFVSADFFASDYCYGIEMQRALEREATGEVRVLPLLVREADWTDAPFAHLQVLPTNAKPIASWPNEDMALTDVAAGIRRAIVEELPQLTASAPRTSLPAIWNIPYPRNPFFLGRDDELLRIRQNLQASQTTAFCQPQAISGLGGIGKTQLALEYVYRYQQDYQAVLWTHADTIEALAAGFITFAEQLPISRKQDQSRIVKLLQDWLQTTDTLVSRLVALADRLKLPQLEKQDPLQMILAVKEWFRTHDRWLLILDNVDDLALLRDFLPNGSAGHVLLTTRTWDMKGLARRIVVEPLKQDLGASLLLHRSGLLEVDAELEQATTRDRATAKEITQELGGLPLALDQAGAYIEATHGSLQEYLALYRRYRATLLKKRASLVPDHPESVATTWSLSFERIKQHNPAALDVLHVCAFLQPDAIPEEILLEGAQHLGPQIQTLVADPSAYNEAIKELLSYSLIQRNPVAQALSIHRLVQAVLQDMMDESTARLWAEQTVEAVETVLSKLNHRMLSRYERYLSQVQSCVLLINQFHLTSQAAARLLHGTGMYLAEQARHTEAEPLYQQALQIWEQALGPEHTKVASSLDGLANLYFDQGKYTEAEPLYQRALKIWEQALSPGNAAMSIPMSNLMILYRKQGKYDQAELLCQRMLSIRKQMWGSAHPRVAYSLISLADLYVRMGKYTQAEPLCQQALQIWEQTLSPEHPEIAYSLSNLASLYYEQGKHPEAEALYQQVLAIWEKQAGHDHLIRVTVLEDLGTLYYEQGKYAEAEALRRRVMSLFGEK